MKKDKTCSVCGCFICSNNKSGLCFEHVNAAAHARRDGLREQVEQLFVEQGLPFKEISRRLGISTRYARELTDLRRPHKIKLFVSNPIIADIVAVVSDTVGVPVEKIMGHCRIKRYANARQIAFLIAREQGYSFPDIARATGRDHTTVIFGVRAIVEKATRNPGLDQRIKMARQRYAKAVPGFSERLLSRGNIITATVDPNDDLPLDQAMRNAEMTRSSSRFINALRMAA